MHPLISDALLYSNVFYIRNRSHILVGLICLVIGILIGFLIGWNLYKPTVVHETAAPEQRLEDIKVTVLERLPESVAPVPEPIKKATKRIGGKLERAATVVVQPKVKEGSSDDCECEDVVLDVGVVDQGDGKRIITHTDTGTILSGTDISVVPYQASKVQKWEVGAVVPVENPSGVGPYVSRKVGPFSVGVQAMQPSSEMGWTAMATVGVRF